MKCKTHQVIYVGLIICVGMLMLWTSCQKLDDPAKPSTVITSVITDTNTTDVYDAETRRLMGYGIMDSLTNGTSVGTVSGGVFTSSGYTITDDQGLIMYDTGISGDIQVEFDARGYVSNESPHGSNDSSAIVVMHDADDPYVNWPTQWRSLPNCLLQLLKLTYYPGLGDADKVKFKGGCNGGATGFETSFGPLDWDSGTTYHWTISVSNGQVNVYRNGVLLKSESGFQPNNRIILTIGGGPGGAYNNWYSSPNVTYSNVVITPR
jgi:hypothetical protein